jgi:hypothetical protein
MNAYSNHHDVAAWWFCRFRKEKNKKEAGAVKQAEADFIKNPYTKHREKNARASSVWRVIRPERFRHFLWILHAHPPWNSVGNADTSQKACTTQVHVRRPLEASKTHIPSCVAILCRQGPTIQSQFKTQSESI